MLQKLLYYSCFLLLIACSNKQKPDPAKYIPTETALVLVINSPMLIDKIKTNAFIKLDSVLKDMLTKKDNDYFKNQLEEFNESIDLKEKLYFFVSPKTIMGKSTASINFMGLLKNGDKLEATLKNNKDWKSLSITKKDNFTYALIENKYEVSWNKEVVIFSVNPEKDGKEYDFKTHTVRFIPADTNALLKQVSKYYSLAENESVASIKQFNELQKEPADLYTFSNSSFLTSYTSQLTVQPVRLDSFISNNYYAASINFNKGKVVLNGTIYLNDALKSLSKRYAGGVVNTDLLDKYPSNNVNSFILSSFNPAIFDGLIKDMDIAAITDVLLQKAGISKEDITQSFTGDLSIVFSDFSISNKGTNNNCIVMAGIHNKISAEKLLGLTSSIGFLSRMGDDYTINSSLPVAGTLHADQNKLLYSSSTPFYNLYLLGKNKNNIPEDIKQAVKGRTSAGYINIDSYLSGVDNVVLNEMSPSGVEVKTLLKSTLKDAFVNSENNNDGIIKTHGELRLKDTAENSLIQLHNMTMHISEKVAKARAQSFPESDNPSQH
jgi:Domain of unknown function (DUF4836)